MQTQGKLQNGRHQKWSTYLKQLHLNIKYKKGSTNQIIDFLSRPPIASLTTVLNSFDHKTSGWPQLYESDHEFSPICQSLYVGTPMENFHLQEGLLFHLVHLWVPSSECAKMI